jgi:hypothetical protein
MTQRHTGHMAVVRVASILALTAVLAAGATPAAAQDGPVVDPDSPTGKEYALPLDTARREAAGEKGKAATAGESAPLFGEGIEAGGSGDPSPGKRTRSGASSHSKADGTAHVAGDAPAAAARILAGARPGAPSDGGLSPLVAVGGGVLLLACGAAAGLALRRRSRDER